MKRVKKKKKGGRNLVESISYVIEESSVKKSSVRAEQYVNRKWRSEFCGKVWILDGTILKLLQRALLLLKPL